jgi:hypothetical protein
MTAVIADLNFFIVVFIALNTLWMSHRIAEVRAA